MRVESAPRYWRTTTYRLRLFEDLGWQHFNNPGDIEVVKLMNRYYQVTESEQGIKLILLDDAHQEEMRKRNLPSELTGGKISENK